MVLFHRRFASSRSFAAVVFLVHHSMRCRLVTDCRLHPLVNQAVYECRSWWSLWSSENGGALFFAKEARPTHGIRPRTCARIILCAAIILHGSSRWMTCIVSNPISREEAQGRSRSPVLRRNVCGCLPYLVVLVR
jgi:hypothetical protein